ncbi:MAG: hypothetical protein ACFFD2_28950, partial [Promethearchaeota archaeon]
MEKKRNDGIEVFQGKSINSVEKKALEDLIEIMKEEKELEFQTENGHVVDLECRWQVLTFLPDSFRNFTELRVLWLDNNKFK